MFSPSLNRLLLNEKFPNKLALKYLVTDQQYFFSFGFTYFLWKWSGSLKDGTFFMISSISSLNIMSIVIWEPCVWSWDPYLKMFFWIVE